MAKVLIIDQDAHLTELLKSYLSGQGFKVFAAGRGEDGMTQALKVKPDVIILDALMPDATGFQMCLRFRNHEATQGTPIIMMSSLARFPNQQKYAIERGANEFVAKPLKVFELGELVDKYVGASIARGEYKEPEGSQDIPQPRQKYTLATDIHRHLSDWLGKALAREEKDPE